MLPQVVPFADAVFNLGGLGLLLAGLADVDGLVPMAGDDRLHQGARTALVPGGPAAARRAARGGGGRVVLVGGVGPTLLGICRSIAEAEAVALAASSSASARSG